MELKIENGEIKAVQHNSCKRGPEYAQQEFYDPHRMVTTTAAVSGGIVDRIPVRISAPIPVKHINALLQAIYALRLAAPIQIETALISNFANTGVDVIATRNITQLHT